MMKIIEKLALLFFALTVSTIPSLGQGLNYEQDPNGTLQRILQSQIVCGTELTGVLENNIASDLSTAGQIVSIRLTNGFAANGLQLIPPQSQILGRVTAVSSAKNQRSGMPGILNLALERLIFPDGRSFPFSGSIDYNPVQIDAVQNNPDWQKGANDYFKKAPYFAWNYLIGQRFSHPIQAPNYGNELRLNAGEVLKIKLNQNLDLSSAIPPIGINQMPPYANFNSAGSAPSTVSGVGNATPTDPLHGQDPF